MKVRIRYTNWKGKTEWRLIIPKENGMRFDSTEFHPTPQWLMDAFDVDKQADRTFAVNDISSWNPIKDDTCPRCDGNGCIGCRQTGKKQPMEPMSHA